MATITIKNIPDDIYRKVRDRAEAHDRSISGEIIACLEKSVTTSQLTPEEILNRARTLRSKAKGSLSSKEVSEAIKNGRP